jgi:hypothetical protein
MLACVEKRYLYMTAVIFMGQIVPVKSARGKRQFEGNWPCAKPYVKGPSSARPFYASGCATRGSAHIRQA